MSDERNKIYISHANPEDNVFARWLALKLMAFGYNVWCDLIQQELGPDFWKTFEHEIRNNSKRFLFVASRASKVKPNALRELAVADATKRSLQDDKFVIALRSDPHLPFGELDPVLIRTNAADFTQGWSQGLMQIVQQFEKDNVPRSSASTCDNVAKWWKSVYASSNSLLSEPDMYSSNWFPIETMPETLFVHSLATRNNIGQTELDGFVFPAKFYKNKVLTFGNSRETSRALAKYHCHLGKTVGISVRRIVDGSYDTAFIPNRHAKLEIIELFNKAWNQYLQNLGLIGYEMASGRFAHWVRLSGEELPVIGKGQLIGIQKLKHWHFAVSAWTKLYPFPAVGIYSHIVFTTDGKEIIESASLQHKARRRQGRNWWNAHWRDKLWTMVKHISNGASQIKVPLSLSQHFGISVVPCEFHSPVSYREPIEAEESLEALAPELQVDDLDVEDEDEE